LGAELFLVEDMFLEEDKLLVEDMHLGEELLLVEDKFQAELRLDLVGDTLVCCYMDPFFLNIIIFLVFKY
jgi:hypothetical protein